MRDFSHRLHTLNTEAESQLVPIMRTVEGLSQFLSSAHIRRKPRCLLFYLMYFHEAFQIYASTDITSKTEVCSNQKQSVLTGIIQNLSAVDSSLYIQIMSDPNPRTFNNFRKVRPELKKMAGSNIYFVALPEHIPKDYIRINLGPEYYTAYQQMYLIQAFDQKQLTSANDAYETPEPLAIDNKKDLKNRSSKKSHRTNNSVYSVNIAGTQMNLQEKQAHHLPDFFSTKLDTLRFKTFSEVLEYQRNLQQKAAEEFYRSDDVSFGEKSLQQCRQAIINESKLKKRAPRGRPPGKPRKTKLNQQLATTVTDQQVSDTKDMNGHQNKALDEMLDFSKKPENGQNNFDHLEDIFRDDYIEDDDGFLGGGMPHYDNI